MESSEASVEYTRWSEENTDMRVPQSESRMTRLYNTLCTGRLGIVTKVAACFTMLAVIYIAGYITGYYFHKCG